MGLFDDAVPGGSIAKPLMIAIGALLVGKLLSGNKPAEEAPAQIPAPTPGAAPEADGGLLGGLGGLLDKLKQAGHADTADSWVGTGQNAPIQPGQLGGALGQQTVSDLARQAGMSEQELLAQLSKVLPGLVDKLTPGGRVPNTIDLSSLFGQR